MTKFVGGENTGMDWSADLGPLVGVKRGFKTGEGVPFSGRLSGVEFVSEGEEVEVEAGPSRTVTAPKLPTLTVMSPKSEEGKEGCERERKGGRCQ
jgi:hypothetical protein